MTAFIGRREFITLLGGAAARGRLRRGRSSRERMRRVGMLDTLAADDPEASVRSRRVHAGTAGVGLDHRPQPADRCPLGRRRYRPHSQPCCRNGRAWSRRDLYQRILDHSAAARRNAHGPDRVRECRRSGRRRLRRKPGAARRQRHRFPCYEFGFTIKWLELLKQIAPGVTRAAVLRDPSISALIGQFAAIQGVAPSFGVEVTPIDVRDADEFQRAVATFVRGPTDGLIVLGGPSANAQRDLIAAMAARHRIPAVYAARYFVTAGGLISYGPDLVDQFRRAAGYVDRILKGEKPADLPVQAPTKYELVINLKTAKALGLECRRRCSPAPTR